MYTLSMCRIVTLLFLLSALASSVAASDTAIAHLGAANQFFEQERFEEAANEYQQVLDNRPRLLAARRDLAVCRFELHQYEPAEKLLLELLTHPATNSLARYYLGRIKIAQGQFDAAIAQFLSTPRGRSFRDERYFLAMAYFKSGLWKNSEKTLQESIRENPRDFRSHQLLARALQKLGRQDAAAREFLETRRLLSYYTEGSQAIKRCGQLLANKAGDAEKFCQPLFETDDVDKLAALGMLLGNTRLFGEARAAWERAAALDPESPEIHYDLALTCFHLGNRICARDNAKAAIHLRADFPEATVLYASVLYMMGADADALPALRRAHALQPGDSSVRELLSRELVLWAEQFAKTGKTVDARALLLELDGLQPLRAEQAQRLLEVRRRLDK
jgi:tetratricopeptide (TPR) repeat protein